MIRRRSRGPVGSRRETDWIRFFQPGDSLTAGATVQYALADGGDLSAKDDKFTAIRVVGEAYCWLPVTAGGAITLAQYGMGIHMSDEDNLGGVTPRDPFNNLDGDLGNWLWLDHGAFGTTKSAAAGSSAWEDMRHVKFDVKVSRKMKLGSILLFTVRIQNLLGYGAVATANFGFYASTLVKLT